MGSSKIRCLKSALLGKVAKCPYLFTHLTVESPEHAQMNIKDAAYVMAYLH